MVVAFREAREGDIEELFVVRAATRENGISREELEPETRAYGFHRSLGWRPVGERDSFGDEILVLSNPDRPRADEGRNGWARRRR